jgi:hypothetical protein
MFGVSAESARALVRLNAALNDPRVSRALAAVEDNQGGARAEVMSFEVR